MKRLPDVLQDEAEELYVKLDVFNELLKTPGISLRKLIKARKLFQRVRDRFWSHCYRLFPETRGTGWKVFWDDGYCIRPQAEEPDGQAEGS